MSEVRETDFHELALHKMSGVLGAERAERLITQILDESDFTLDSPDALFRFAAELSKRGGFEAALGAMLSMTAVMKGASRR